MRILTITFLLFSLTVFGSDSKACYLAPSGALIKSCNQLFFTASFTYDMPIQENMGLGVVSDSSAPLDLLNGYSVNISNDYKPGFKVGFGTRFDYDNWSTYLTYTWFRGSQTAIVSLDFDNSDIVLFPAWQTPEFLNPRYKQGFEWWDLEMDLVDWDLARSSQFGRKLTLTPFVGMRAAFIRQKLHVDYINLSEGDIAIWPSTTIDSSSSSWAVGPRFGFTSSFNLPEGFRLQGNTEMDLLFTQYDLKSEEVFDEEGPNRFQVRHNDENYLRTHAEIGMGLGWSRYLYECDYHLDFLANYLFQVYFDQNMFRTSALSQSRGGSFLPNGNLYLHGLRLSAKFDF